MNLWGNAWKDLLTRITKIMFQDKWWIHWVTTTWCTNLVLCLKQWKHQIQKQQWMKKRKNSECQTSKDIVDNYRGMFESRIPVRAIEKLPSSGKLDANISSFSYDMEGHAKKCVERYCELANKTTHQLHKVATPCFDDHQFKEDLLENCQKVCAQVVLKCMYLAFRGPWTNLLVLSLNGPEPVTNA